MGFIRIYAEKRGHFRRSPWETAWAKILLDPPDFVLRTHFVQKFCVADSKFHFCSKNLFVKSAVYERVYNSFGGGQSWGRPDVPHKVGPSCARFKIRLAKHSLLHFGCIF